MASRKPSQSDAHTATLIAGSNARFRLMLLAHASWILFLCVLLGWWVLLALRQASRIAELERALGKAASLAQSDWERTYRMIFWESSAFFTLLIASGALLFLLYWRDLRRNRVLQAFFASVTHELRTPLTSIRLQAESVAESLAANAAESSLLRRLLEDTQRLEGQVERTLELARLEGGGAVTAQPVQLQPIVGRLLTRWRQNYGDRIEVNSAIDDVTVSGDPAAIEVILKNLLENALRHARKDRVRVELSAVSGPEGVELSYRDDGKGFQGNPKELGNAFYRGPGSSGSGIGLYLMKVLMRQMGGRAEFRPGAGDGFAVRLLFRESGGQNRRSIDG
ncbi:MAG: HAMP domain-containing histidine kinase [Oligoflexia bacterium]|nr:HAMP domain-containing histidine kinase [Oligoflexia bacterium]